MMKIVRICFFFLVMLPFILFLSCKKDKGGSGTKTSSYTDNSSHNVGTSCMSCHSSGSSNQYWWVVAGTVYKPDSTDLSPNSTIYLFTAVNGGGSLVLTLPADEKANFYTTSSVNFGTGLYPEVKGLTGEVKYMQESTTVGNCNSCHNVSNRIMVN